MKDEEKDLLKLFFLETAKKHKVKIEDLNLHIDNNQLCIQEYTPDGITEFKYLEIIDLK